MQNVLIIRFSSWGDITQALTAAEALKSRYPTCQIHWVTRSDFAEFVGAFQAIDQVHKLPRKEGLLGLIRLGIQLRRLHFDLIFDAHSNLRSRILSFLLFSFSRKLIRRSKERLRRLLYFKFGVKTFSWPYRGALSYVRPLRAYVLEAAPHLQLKAATTTPASPYTDKYVLLAPSAAWDLKKWPTEHWIALIEGIRGRFPNQEMALLGGPEDDFSQIVAKTRIENWAGKLSWLETTYAIARCKALVSGDTGALHVGDALNRPTVAILGPTAFGHPARANSIPAEIPLWCRPCTKDGRGRCYNPSFKKCLVDVTPDRVLKTVEHVLGA